MDDLTFNLLKFFSERDRLSLHDLGAIFNAPPENFASPLQFLLQHGYLEINPTYSSLHGTDFTLNAPLQITYNGKVYLEVEQKERRSYKFSELRSWITLAIAAAAFLLSILSLYLQYG